MDVTHIRQKELTMTGLRSNGFVVSLAALAFFVSGMVIQRQFDRSHPGFVTISDHDFFGQDFSLSPNGQPIHTPLGDFSADSDFSAGCQGLVTFNFVISGIYMKA